MEPKNTVLLPTTVVGSYSVPEWLERLKTEYYQRRISAQHMSEIHEVAIKAAVKDQELAGINIVSDGELRRDNDVDYFLARIPGVHIPQRAKTDYFDYYDAEVTRPLPEVHREGPGPGRRFPVHPPGHAAARQVLLHRAVLAVPPDPRRRVLRARRAGPRAGPPAQRRGAEAGRGRRRPAADRRALPGRVPGAGRAGGRGGQHRHRGRTGQLGAARVLRKPVRAAVLGGALRLPVPRGEGRPRRPGRARVRPQGPGRPAADPAARLGQVARPGGDRRQEPGGRGGRAGRVPDQAGPGLRPGRPPDDQPRLRAAAPRARSGQAEAARHGGWRRPGQSRATRIGPKADKEERHHEHRRRVPVHLGIGDRGPPGQGGRPDLRRDRGRRAGRGPAIEGGGRDAADHRSRGAGGRDHHPGGAGLRRHRPPGDLRHRLRHRRVRLRRQRGRRDHRAGPAVGRHRPRGGLLARRAHPGQHRPVRLRGRG